MKYRKKPVVIEAMQYTGNNYNKVCDFVGKKLDKYDSKLPSLIIETLEGNHMASIGDYIIKGVQGEFYPCKPDIFEQTYEVVE